MYYNKGLLIVLSGPSGVGKGTICKALLENNPNIELSVSITTRKPRTGELDGISYHFREEDQFKEMIKHNGFLEYAKVYGNYYGTPKEHVIEKLNKGKDLILEIDTQGAMQVKDNFAEGVFIFIMPPSFKELKNRIINRGTDSIDTIDRRLKNTYNELQEVYNYDYLIFNDDILSAVENISSIIKAERYKINRYSFDFSEYREEL